MKASRNGTQGTAQFLLPYLSVCKTAWYIEVCCLIRYRKTSICFPFFLSFWSWKFTEVSWIHLMACTNEMVVGLVTKLNSKSLFAFRSLQKLARSHPNHVNPALPLPPTHCTLQGSSYGRMRQLTVLGAQKPESNPSAHCTDLPLAPWRVRVGTIAMQWGLYGLSWRRVTSSDISDLQKAQEVFSCSSV